MKHLRDDNAGVVANKSEWGSLAKDADFSHFTVKKNLAEVWAQPGIELLNPQK
ncbi:hypothetical protein QWZ04_15690 [Vibrio tapetis subsp. quintayensis]|uniref:hypothetical protein n=1 Tax=Vibrio tapetis TaxID=52443 RepID=UPI0025B3604E|nr:hypothetical protein [Vibrio tapetis]MDN3681747.1 hypothetical protein [Vibrio tapetis subsp. quintayensis]